MSAGPSSARGPRGIRLLKAWLLLGALSGAILLAQDFPAPVGKVNDFANILQPAQRDLLELQLADLERATSAEVAVVTTAGLNGRSVEEYATALFNTWGIGKKGRDNGVLILVSPGDRAMRIELATASRACCPTAWPAQ